MSADEQLRRIGGQLLFYGRIIPGWISADMCHEYFHSFRLPAKPFGIFAADVLSVDIAIDATEGSEGGKRCGQLCCAEIAGMPDLVAGFEMTENGFIEEMMCIGQQADVEHSGKFKS